MHANGRRLFRAAVRLHAYAAVCTNLSPYRAVFEAFLRLIYRIRQSRFVRSLRPSYPPFALEVPAATAAGIFHFRRTAAPSCRFPVVFPSPSGCFPPPLSGYHSGSFWSPSRRRPACFSCDFRLLSRRSLVALPSPSRYLPGCLPGCLSIAFRFFPAAVPLQPFLTYADDSGPRIL